MNIRYLHWFGWEKPNEGKKKIGLRFAGPTNFLACSTWIPFWVLGSMEGKRIPHPFGFYECSKQNTSLPIIYIYLMQSCNAWRSVLLLQGVEV